MKPHVKKYKVGEEPETDIEYWKQITPIERLEALEAIRQHYINFFLDGVQPRFRSVYKVIKRKPS